MPRIRFVHAADLHLDTPFEGIARPAPHVAELLRDASLGAWDDLVRFTIAQDAAALLLAGDIYDGARRGVRAQLRFLSGVRALSQAGIQVFVVHGNHDPLEGWSAIREWPAGVHVFGSREVETVPLLRQGAQVASVHGISYGRRDVGENLAARFQRGGAPGVHLGLLHANVGGAGDHAPYAPCLLSDLEDSGIDYWALGHIHRRTVLHEGDPWVVYPGNLQGRSPKPSELGAKGAFLVEIDADIGKVLAPEFHALDRVRFVSLDHDVGDCADLGLLQDELGAALERLRGEHDRRALLVRVTLVGRGPVIHDLRQADALSHLRDELCSAFSAVSPPLWVDSLLDRAAPALDLDAIRARGEFSAEVLCLADRLAANPQELAEFVAARSAALRTGQTGRQVRTLPADPEQEILAEALARILDRLEPGEAS